MLFGGGLTLASAVISTGLAEWLGSSLQAVGTLPLLAIVIVAAGDDYFPDRIDQQHCDDGNIPAGRRRDRY